MIESVRIIGVVVGNSWLLNEGFAGGTTHSGKYYILYNVVATRSMSYHHHHHSAPQKGRGGEESLTTVSRLPPIPPQSQANLLISPLHARWIWLLL